MAAASEVAVDVAWVAAAVAVAVVVALIVESGDDGSGCGGGDVREYWPRRSSLRLR